MGEPGRTKAYHEDLRWRIVWQRITKNKTIRDISADLCVANSTIWRILDRFERTGRVTPNAATSRDHALHEHDEMLLIQMVCENPSVHLHEVQRKLHEVTGTEASIATICRSLKRNGFSRKKVQFIALQRSDRLRAEYQAEVSVYDSSMLVFLDETGCKRKDAMRKFGYSLREYPAKSVRLLAKGKHYSAIGIMTTTSFLDCYVVEGTVDGDVFYHFVQSSLLPQLMPFNGTNPNSVVIMDNCSIHHLHDVIKLIHSVAALVLFLPPYSPDLMPIEECFSKVKHFLRLHEAVAQSVQDIKLLITAAFASVTPDDCFGWSCDCGYIN